MAARGACKITSINGPLTVTFTAASGATPTVYSDDALTSTVSLPATVADGATSTFYFPSPGTYTLSVKTASGVQIAGDLNTTKTISVFPGEVAAYAYDGRLVTADKSGDSGRHSPGTDLSATYLPLPLTYAPSQMPLSPTLSDGGGPGVTWLSADGVTVFGGGTDSTLRWSTNDATSWSTHSFAFAQGIQWVRDTPDGEILVSCWDGTSAGVLYKSSGWTANHATATFSIVKTASAAGNMFARWGISIYQGIVLLNEYGNKAGGGTQARYCYRSTDYGATFTTIFDLVTTLVSGSAIGNISGTHLHGVCHDPYANGRIWLSWGDTQATGKIAYSDDSGTTWKWATVANADANHGQVVGIYALTRAVVFLTDQPPNAIRTWARDPDLTQTPVIHNAYYLDNADAIRWLGMTAYQRTSGSGNFPLLMSFEPQGSAGPSSLVIGTVDGLTFYELWRDTVLVVSNGMFSFVGPTASGNYVGSIAGDGRQSNYTLVKATAPTWAAAGLATAARSQLAAKLPNSTITNKLDLPFGQETFPYYMAAGSIGLANQRAAFAHFTAIRTEQVGWIYSATAGTAAGATPTLCKLGIWLVDPSSGDLTLVASTANDTTLWAATTTLYKTVLTSAYTLVEGQRYALGALCVTAATAPILAGCSPAAGNAGFWDSRLVTKPRLRGALVTGQTDVANVANANLGSAGSIPWLAVSP